MARLNKIYLIGRLTRDVEARFLPNGTPTARFSLAVNRKFKKQGAEKEETDFIDCVAWSRLAELAGKYLSKGSQVMVEGRLQIRSFVGKDGVNRRMAEVICEEIQFLGGRGASGGGDTSANRDKGSAKGSVDFPSRDEEDFYSQDDMPEGYYPDDSDEGIPF